MSVWMEIYEQADELIRQWRMGKIDVVAFEKIESALNIKLKTARGEATCEIASMKEKELKKSLKSKRLLANDGTAMGGCFSIPSETVRVKCEEKADAIISRSECLEYSGSKEHLEDCKGCANFSVTRDLILGPK